MDEIRATFTCTEKKMREFYLKYLLFKPLNIALLIFILLTGAAMLTTGLIIQNMQVVYLSAAVFGIFIFLIVFILLMVKKSAKLSHAQYMEINGGQPLENQIIIGGGMITLINPLNNNRSVIMLSLLKTVFATKNLVLLVTVAKQAVILDKETVSGGWESCVHSLKNMLSARAAR